MESFQEFITRKVKEYGNKFDPSELALPFVKYYESGERIEVETHGESKRGTIGVTTGWKPCFLLMLRRNSRSSSITLGKTDQILKVL